jgi:3-deoxy-D-manno-octulosonic-acid transferase
MHKPWDHPLVKAYGLAWRLALPGLRAVAAFDRILHVTSGINLLPPRWEAGGRLAASENGGNAEDTAWLHCASLGEAKGIWALAQRLDFPGRVLLTANTAAGLAFLRERCRGREGMRASVAPFDHPALVGRFLKAQGVRILCLYEVEWWPHYILSCHRLGIPVVLASARLPAKPLARGPWSGLLGTLSWIQTQSDADTSRFRSLTEAPVETGFDFKAAHYLEGAPLRPAAVRARFAFMSLHWKELLFFLPVMPGLMRRFPIAVFPRHLRELARFRRALEPLGFLLHSQSPSSRHVLVDALGKVGDMLPECHSAFVGGSLVKDGCHNLWEPLAAGLKIHFGPLHENQQPLAGLLLGNGLAEVVETAEQTEGWREPGPGQARACAELADGLRRDSRAALERFRARLLTLAAARPRAQAAQAETAASSN